MLYSMVLHIVVSTLQISSLTLDIFLYSLSDKLKQISLTFLIYSYIFVCLHSIQAGCCLLHSRNMQCIYRGLGPEYTAVFFVSVGNVYVI